MVIISSIEQLCAGKGTHIKLNRTVTSQQWMLGGKIISIRDGQMVFDDNGFKCTVKNYSRKVHDFSTFRVYT